MRPARHKKPVNYSQFEDSDSDGDFVSTASLKKKPRTDTKELKQEKPKPKLTKLKKEDSPLQEKAPNKRMALDDKLYHRDLELALALSVKQTPTISSDSPEARDPEHCDSNGTEARTRPPHVSNCSVTSDYVDLDEITEEDDLPSVRGKRQAAAKGAEQQREILLGSSDGDSVGNSEPDFDSSSDSAEDSDVGESEDADDNFTVSKSKAKARVREEEKAKPPVERAEKNPKSKCSALALAVSAPVTAKSGSPPSPKKVSISAEIARTPSQIGKPPTASSRPKWVPPGSRGNCSSSRPAAGVLAKSPNQSLRLGLSRLARVKPLHPTVAST
ncbi:RAD51-associated protein 1 isoform X1 [Tenrec ecaudatus]|uniref:RAD51-associated protein 1 isoform X1 n=1 Tax=Tenrec ecaudatus TaxID=94439 RepID=UPI003F599EB1